MAEVKENNCFAYTAIDGLPGYGECFALQGLVYFKHNGRMIEVPTQMSVPEE